MIIFLNILINNTVCVKKCFIKSIRRHINYCHYHEIYFLSQFEGLECICEQVKSDWHFHAHAIIAVYNGQLISIIA